MNKKLILTSLMGILISGCFYQTPKIPSQKIDTNGSVLSDLNATQEAKEAPKFIKDFSALDKYLGKNAGKDCSGFVFLANKEYENFFFEPEDVSKNYDKKGRRSKAIYNLFKRNDKISQNFAKSGDLIFFANTLGRGAQSNKDKENITHVGIITQVFKSGRVEFIHNLNGVIKKGYMNLGEKNSHKKDGKVQNSYIIKCKKGVSNCLTSQRFAGFGEVW